MSDPSDISVLRNIGSRESVNENNLTYKVKHVAAEMYWEQIISLMVGLNKRKNHL